VGLYLALAVMASRRPELYGELTETKHRDEALRRVKDLIAKLKETS